MADDVALFEINEKSSIPIWLQLKNRFIYLITSGYYKPGDQLPTVDVYKRQVTTCVPLLKTKAHSCPCGEEGLFGVDGRVR